MSRTILTGVSGASSLGFLASLGLLKLLNEENKEVRLGFLSDGTFRPFVEGLDGDVVEVVVRDASPRADSRPWWLSYEKAEKNGVKTVADLKAPPEVFAGFLSSAAASWVKGEYEAAAYAAAFGTSVVFDGKGNTKPTAFHFTAANQQFLGTVEAIRASVTEEWTRRSLFEGNAARPGSNLRWDTAAERNWALMANNPNESGTSVDAPLEWLAFRALSLFPSFPRGSRIMTTAVRGRGDDMELVWPLWCEPISLHTAQSVLQINWSAAPIERRMRGAFAICTSAIRRTSQGFGNFSPSDVR